MAELTLVVMVVLSGVAAVLSNRFAKRILILAGLSFAFALLTWAVFVASIHSGSHFVQSVRDLIVWLIFSPFAISVSLALGCLLHAVGINRGISRKALVSSITITAVFTSLSLFKVQYVERHVFDSSAPSADSDYIVARGLPVAFYAEVPAKKIRISALLSDMSVWFYVSVLLSLSI